MNTAEQTADFAPTRFVMLVDGGPDLYRAVRTVSDAVRRWDGTDSPLALQSNTDTRAHHTFRIERVTGRRVRIHRWGMAGVRVSIRFDGETETVGAWLLAETLDMEEARELALAI